MQFRERLWAALTPRERLAVLSAQAKPKLPPRRAAHDDSLGY
jgi:hypothetical protein